jgi:hypothetical protein
MGLVDHDSLALLEENADADAPRHNERLQADVVLARGDVVEACRGQPANDLVARVMRWSSASLASGSRRHDPGMEDG